MHLWSSDPEPPGPAERTGIVEEPRTQEEAEGYGVVFDTLPQPCWIYDLDTRRLLDANLNTAEQFGYTREELLGLRLEDIFPGEVAPLDGSVWHGRAKDGSALEL